jgi:hypothetical protein
MKMRAAALFLVAFGITGCDSNYENPFSGAGKTVAPPAEADLLFLQSPDAGPITLREIYALDIDGSSAPTRLTSCVLNVPGCDIVEAAPAPDRQRVIVRRRTDNNGDGAIQAGEPQSVVVMDLARAIEGEVLADQNDVDSLQWTSDDPPLLFSAAGTGGLPDLFASAQDGTNVSNFSQSATIRERHPRLARQILTFEHTVPGSVSEIWGAFSAAFTITRGDTSLPPTLLPGTDYILGSDADADIAPDASKIVFRRLVGLGEDNRGAWDIYTIEVGGTAPVAVPLAVGGFHGAPVWSAKGIVFVEVPPGSATASLIHITPDGTRRTLLAGAPLTLQSPRWLP